MSRWIGPALMLIGVAVMAFGLALNNSSSPAAPPARSVLIPMGAAAWNILYSPSMPAHPFAGAGGGWFFDFPSCGGMPTCSVNYVTIPVNIAASTDVRARFEISTTGKPVFHYMLNPDNTCPRPAHVRLLLERKGDDLSAEKQYWRWWSDPMAFELAQGTLALTVPLTPDQWVSVFGRRGDVDPDAQDGFRQTIHHIGNVGFTFGGGCFFGHGVNVTDGTARFYAADYSLR